MRRLLLAPCLAVACVLATGLSLRAQSAAPAFEVASIKPSNPNPTGPLAGTPMMLPALGRLTAQNVTLRMLVMAAYQKQPFQIVGGPDWQNSAKFDINATAGDPKLSTDAMLARLQTLLADRFKLKLHTETREVPIYALVLARDDGRLGPKMKPSTAECPGWKEQQQKQLEAIAKGGLAGLQASMPKPGESVPCAMVPLPPQPGIIGIRGTGQSLDLVTLLLTQFTGRPVVNKTGLTGLFDVDIEIGLQALMELYAQIGVPVPPLPANMPESRSIMTMIQEDWGLKLDSQRGPGEVLVIDSAEMPTPD
jgi:uncharacterized protein (TIGR03435 family)